MSHRKFSTYPVIADADLKDRLLAWASALPVCCLLDTLGYQLPHHSYDMLIGAGVSKQFDAGQNLLSSLSAFDASTQDWIFGHVGYNAFSDTGVDITAKKNGSGFPGVFLFVPEIVICLKGDILSIGVLNHEADEVFSKILKTTPLKQQAYRATLNQRESRSQFIRNVVALQEHIHRGDCYEINYCQEFFIESLSVDPAELYKQLARISPNPFASFYKVHDQYALCASPERYIKRTGERLISQPIKGTAARVPDNAESDENNRRLLQESEKDRRENVIVVDLVRNDLSRVCKAGTVVVEELCGVYAFPTVYQMMSTVAGDLGPGQDFASVLNATFPMGSMTGAPKTKVLELIDRYEMVNRGLYSGTIGYIDPEKNFDFNVVIRTLLYNAKTGYLNYFAGAGITALSDPEQEYEECLLKATAVSHLFGGSKAVNQSQQP